MAISNDSLNIQTTFELNNDPKNFKIEDTTDYAAEGVALADVVGVFKIVAPDGSTTYVNTDFGTPDIDADVSLTFSSVSLPLDSDDNVLTGDYVITYTIQVGGADEYTKVFTYNNQHSTPTVSILWDVDIRSSKITATDSTSYGSYVDSGGITRTFTLRPPAFSGLGDTVVSTASVSTSPITDQTWAAQVSSVVNYTYSDGLKVVDLVEGSSETDVDADSSLCDIYCGIKTVADKYTSYRTENPTEAERYRKEKIVPMLTYMALWERADACGKDDDKQTYYDAILSTAGVNPGCSCEGDEPTLIIATSGGGGSSAESVVAVCGNGAINLSTVVVGDTTTYTICFDDDLLAWINAFETITVTGGANTTVTPSSTAASGATPKSRDFNIDVDLGDRPSMLIESFEYDPDTSTLTKLTTDTIGSHFKASTGTRVNGTSSFEDIRIKVDDYFASTPVDCNVIVQLQSIDQGNEDQDAFDDTPIEVYSRVFDKGDPTEYIEWKLWQGSTYITNGVVGQPAIAKYYPYVFSVTIIAKE